MKIPKRILTILVALGFVFNAGAVEAAAINNVTENSPIVLKQNNVKHIQINGTDSYQLQQLDHYSHYSHVSHSSHSSHYSSYY